ncbi:GNAT family acetyltransferase [Lacrimispora sp.]|uniref:GNAT family acetyltransferase n=1 Tax=Lacrimispora sp. TaxID=2719234 RepID=UPI002FDA1E3A
MLVKEKFVPLQFFKREAYTGSRKGMRYRVAKAEDGLEAVVYPGPYCYEATEEEKKTRVVFPFSDEGLGQVVDWINEQYEEHKSIWDGARR